jgi:hypothetical protein
MLQWIMDKNVVSTQKSILPLEECKVNSKTKNRQSSELSNFNRKILTWPKDVDFYNKDDIVKDSLVCLSCDPIYGIENVGSKVDSDDLRASWRSEHNKKDLVYSGRFFDLNEEVERELAAEEENGANNDEKERLIEEITLTNSQPQVQFINIGDASFSSTSSKSTSYETREKIVPTTSNICPLVPKLNFISVLQKNQSNLANGSDTDITHNNMEEDILNNENINLGYKSSDLSLSYDKKRLKRPIYHSPYLHVLLLELLISLMLNSKYVFIIDSLLFFMSYFYLS